MSGYTGITVEHCIKRPGWAIVRRYRDGMRVDSFDIDSITEVEAVRDELTRLLRRNRQAGQ